ncbi:uncharacterized protein LOC144557443 [Carex rostrata]
MAFESWIEEIAKEELKKLENQHPNRFNYLKTELKSLISEPKLEPFFILPEPISLYSNDFLPTQESSNRKRKFDCGTVHNEEFKKKKTRKEACSMHGDGRMKDKVEIVIERAKACLERIRMVKKSLIPHHGSLIN